MKKREYAAEFPTWLMALSYFIPLIFFILLLIYFSYSKANEYRTANTTYDWSHAAYDAYSQNWQSISIKEKEYRENLAASYEETKKSFDDQYRQFQQDQEQKKTQRELIKFNHSI